MAWSGRIVSALTALLLLQSVCGCSKEPDAGDGAQAAHTPPTVKRKRIRPQGEEAAAAAPAESAVAKKAAPEAAKPAEAPAPAPGAAPTESGAVAEAVPAGATPPAPAAAPGAEAVAAPAPAAAPEAAAVGGAAVGGAAVAAPVPADPAAGTPLGAAAGGPAAVPAADTQAADAARAAAETAARDAAAAAEPAADPGVGAAAPIQGARLRGETPPAEPGLDLTGFLTLRDLENRLVKAPPMRHDDLPGIKPTQGYNAIYFTPAKGNAFGVALQVWRDPSLIDSRTRFNTQKNTASNAVDTQILGDLAFRSYFGGVVSLTFVDARQPLVATLSCSVKLCNKDQFIALARTVAERMR